MNDTQKILKALADIVESQDMAEAQGIQLNSKMDTLTGRLDTLELKMEAFHAEQKKANQEIINLIVDASEANGTAHKALEKRVDRIEKHLNLPQPK